MAYKTRNAAAEVSLTATPPLARQAGRWVRWNRRLKAEFLDTLASTCSVKLAAAAIGVDPGSIYALRRRDPEFIREWGIALETGYQMLETLLLGHVIGGGGRVDALDLPERSDSLDYEAALRLLALHRSAAPGGPARSGRRGGPPLKRVDAEETNAALLKKLVAIEKRRTTA